MVEYYSIKRISVSFNVGGFTHRFTQGLRKKSVHSALTAGMLVLYIIILYVACTNDIILYKLILNIDNCIITALVGSCLATKVL